MMQHETTVPVLVVGSGPAGLTTAVTLAHHGVEAMVLERRTHRSTLPKATVMSTRTMEIVRSWGLEQRVRAGGVEVDWLMWLCPTLAAVADGVGIEVGLPTRAQARLISPTEPVCAPQPHLEEILLDHLRALGSARVEIGSELVGLDVGTDGVRAVVLRVDGTEHVVHADYVVGADGARSSVRDALGIGMVGPADVLGGMSSLVRAPVWDLLGDHRYGLYWSELAESLFLPAGPRDEWAFGYFVDPEDDLPRREAVIERLRVAAGVPDLPVHVERIGAFEAGAQLAEHFRRGRAFLVGDAAHRVTPRGGTGMNTAVHDGFDLGWKLAWALKGWAAPSLLDSYEAERRPVAEHNVERSADSEGSRRPAGSELRVDLGGRIAHHWVTAGERSASTLDLVGRGVTLLTGADGSHWKRLAERAGGPTPMEQHSLDELTARALAIGRGGALLVRPDGVPFGHVSAGDDAGENLRRAIERIARADVPAAWADAA